MQTNKSVIISAIQNRHILEFWYHGYPRTVIPAACGTNVRGNYVLRGYQIEGGSSSRTNLPFWSLFLVSDISDLTDTNIYFANTPPQYSRGDRNILIIDAEL